MRSLPKEDLHAHNHHGPPRALHPRGGAARTPKCGLQAKATTITAVAPIVILIHHPSTPRYDAHKDMLGRE